MFLLFLRLGQHAVGQSQRREVHLGDVDVGRLEALVQAVVERLAAKDVEEVSLQSLALDADRVDLVLRVNLVLLDGGIENFLVGIRHVAVGVHQFNHHVLGHLGLHCHVLGDDIAHAAD